MSPLALLGKEPVVTTRFPVTFEDIAGEETHSPPWYLIITALSWKTGVKDVSIAERARLVKQITTHDGHEVEVEAEQFDRVIVVTYNALNVTAGEIEKIISGADARFRVGTPEQTDRAGKTIVIPPDAVG
jgi:hypothetical protein